MLRIDKKIEAQKALCKTRSRAIRDHARVEGAIRKVWSCARRAPCFAKRGVKGEAAGKLRANALVSNTAFKIALAGAGMKIQRELRSDAAIMRVPLKPESKTPLMPSMTVGAQVLVEQFLAALVQEGMLAASAIKDSRRAKRVGYEDAMLGLETVCNRVKDTSTRVISVAPPKKKKGTKKAAPAASEPTPEGEEAASAQPEEEDSM